MTAFQFRRVVTFVEVGGKTVHIDQPAVASTDKAHLAGTADRPNVGGGNSELCAASFTVDMFGYVIAFDIFVLSSVDFGLIP